jgi:hypothetical protein
MRYSAPANKHSRVCACAHTHTPFDAPPVHVYMRFIWLQLDRLKIRASGAHRALQSLLDEDEDMVMMYLSRLHAAAAGSAAAAAASPPAAAAAAAAAAAGSADPQQPPGRGLPCSGRAAPADGGAAGLLLFEPEEAELLLESAVQDVLSAM